MQETQENVGLIPGREDSLEEEMATHASILAWRIPQTEELGGLQSMGSQRVRYDGGMGHSEEPSGALLPPEGPLSLYGIHLSTGQQAIWSQ